MCSNWSALLILLVLSPAFPKQWFRSMIFFRYKGCGTKDKLRQRLLIYVNAKM
jgi:hypothetical protein